MDFNDLRDKILSFWKSNEETIRNIVLVGARSGLALLISYLLASSVATAFIGLLSDFVIQPSGKGQVLQAAVRPDIRKSLNYRDVRRGVVRRNIFNSEGELPDESEPTSEDDSTNSTEFNADDQCTKSTLPISLVGIIFSSDPSQSLATVREKGYGEADVYRPGDAIIGQEQAQVHAIYRESVVINNNGKKECLEVVETKGPKVSRPPSGQPPPPVNEPEPISDNLARIQLESAYVEESLGAGFAKILESGRLVPYNRDGSMVGFKLIGVKAKSLWKKIGLNSGDVVTSVNGLSMAEPDKGFALYEALQNEREINVGVLMKGQKPSNISIEIR